MKLSSLRNFTILYILLTLIELVIEYLDIAYLRYVSKPSLMIALSVFFYFQSQANSKFYKFILFGLIFSLFGDIFLMFVDINENFFLAGLVSFLIAHVLYILGFVDNIKMSTSVLPLSKKVITALPFLIFSGSFMAYAHENLEEMLIPVGIYTSAITVMGISAAWRWQKVNVQSFIWVLGGAIMFILSDSTIALNKFINPIPYASIVIMSLYLVGQYFIAIGSLKIKA